MYGWLHGWADGCMVAWRVGEWMDGRMVAMDGLISLLIEPWAGGWNKGCVQCVHTPHSTVNQSSYAYNEVTTKARVAPTCTRRKYYAQREFPDS